MSKEKLEFLNKVANVRNDIGKITKDSKNPHFKSNYFDINKLLEVLLPLLEANNLTLAQNLTYTTVGGEGGVLPVLESCITDLKTGYEDKITTLMPELKDPQKMGSAITYMRRYVLVPYFNIIGEDDDGEAAVGRGGKSETKPIATTTKAPSGRWRRK